jgi:hypothetical protein
LAGVSAAGPQSRIAAEWSFGMKGLQGNLGWEGRQR